MSRRLVSRTFVSFVIIFGVLAGQLSAKVEQEDKLAQFVHDVIFALNLAEEARQRLGVLSELDVEASTYTMSVLQAQELAIRRFQGARDSVVKSLDGQTADPSDPVDLVMISQNFRSAFEMLERVMREGQQLQMVLASPPPDLDVNELMMTASQHMASVEDAWGLLPPNAVYVTHALVDLNVDDSETLSRLRITSKERRDLILQLELIFSGDIAGDSFIGLSKPKEAAKLLWTFLNSGFKSADDPSR